MKGVKCALRRVALVFWMLRDSWFVRFCLLVVSFILTSLVPLALRVVLLVPVLLLLVFLSSGSGIGG